MSALSVNPPYPIFTETDGQPLEDGYIWIGTANLDPQGNPINVYWDAALTQLAGQPIRTQGGYPVNSGTSARLYVNSDYSIRVMNKNGSTVYSAPAATERYGNLINAQDVVYDPPFAGGVQTNVEAKLAQTVSVLDFGADSTGATDSSAAVYAAIASGAGTIYFPTGDYKFSITLGPVTTPPNFVGDGIFKTNFYKTSPTGTIIAQQQTNVQWAMWEIRGISFGGFPSFNAANNLGTAILFGTIPYSVGAEYAGVCRISQCSFGDFENAIYKAYGNIGNVIEYCNFMNCDYHYRIDDLNTGTAIQPGNDTLYKNHFSYARLASFYMDYGSGGVIECRDNIWENMEGFGVFVRIKNATAFYESPFPQNISHTNSYFESVSQGFQVTLANGNTYVTRAYEWYEGVRKLIHYNRSWNGAIEAVGSTLVMRDSGNVVIYKDNGSFVQQEDLGNFTDATGSQYVAQFFSTGNNVKPIVTKPRVAISDAASGVTVTSSLVYPLFSPVSFSGNNSSTVRDGVIFDVCQEAVVPAGASRTVTLSVGGFNTALYYIVTMDVKQIGFNTPDSVALFTDTKFVMRYIHEITGERVNKWTSLARIFMPDPAGLQSFYLNIDNTGGAGSATYRFSAIQAIGFDSLGDALEYLDSGKYNFYTALPVVFYQNAAPTTGSWIVGDRVVNSVPVVGQPKSWVCTVAGAPGTWVSEGNL